MISVAQMIIYSGAKTMPFDSIVKFDALQQTKGHNFKKKIKQNSKSLTVISIFLAF